MLAQPCEGTLPLMIGNGWDNYSHSLLVNQVRLAMDDELNTLSHPPFSQSATYFFVAVCYGLLLIDGLLLCSRTHLQ